MTFIKITDPKQREALARELYETKQNTREGSLQHRLEKQALSQGLSEVFHPMVEAQKEAGSQITKKIEELPASATALPPPPPKFVDPLPIKQATGNVPGPRVIQYLQLSWTPCVDRTFGLRSEDDGIFIGNASVTFDGDDIFVNGVRYKGTPGLWELMVEKRPEEFEDEDFDHYAQILKNTDAMYKGNSVLSRSPKASKSYKWIIIVSHIYKNQDKIDSGIYNVMPWSAFDQLLERLKLCAAAYRAGNNGLRNEIFTILDTMKQEGWIDDEEYNETHCNIIG